MYSKKSKLVQYLVVGIISIAISLLFFGNNLNAKMGIIDDHRYLTYDVLNRPVVVINNFFNSPEFVSFGKSARFRPIFTLIDNIQTYLWGMNAFYRYQTNIVIFAIFIFSIFYTVDKFINSKIAILFTMVAISQSYLAQIFTRLGTAEVWTILGVSLYSMGFSSAYNKYLRNKPNTNIEWIVMTLGGLLTMWSKENFSIMFVLYLSLFIYLIWTKKLQVISILSSLLLLLANFYEIIYIVNVQKIQGVDFYQNNSDTISRLTMVISGIQSPDAQLFSLALIVFLIILPIEIILQKQKKLDIAIRVSIITLIATIIILFNLYVYNYIYYINHRYSFPTVFGSQIIWLCNFYLVNHIITIILPKQIKLFHKIVYFSLFILFSFLCVNNLKYSRHISNVNVFATNNFQEKLKAIELEIKKCPDCVVILKSFHPVDYEPLLLSTPRYLINDGIHNKLMVNASFDQETINNPLTKWLTTEILNYKTYGGTYFIPYKLLTHNCLIIDYSGITKDSHCKVIGQLWPVGEYIY